MKTRILNIMLSLVMTLTMVAAPVSAAESASDAETVTPVFYDLSNTFNTSIFANENETVPQDGSWGYYDKLTTLDESNKQVGTEGYYNGFTATLTEEGKGGWNTYFSTSENKYLNYYSSEKNTLSYPKEDINLGINTHNTGKPLDDNATVSGKISGDTVPFKIESDSLNVNGKNAYTFGAYYTDLKIKGSETLTNYVYMLFSVGNLGTWPYVTLEFTDGTTTTYRFCITWARAEDGWKRFCQKPDLYLDSATNTVKVAPNVDPNSSKLRAFAIQTGGKAVKNITINTNHTALVAITELPMTAAEYMKINGEAITAAFATAVANPTYYNMSKVVDFADDMIKNNIPLSNMGDNAEATVAKYRTQTAKSFYDLSDVFNTSIFGEVGNSVTAWGVKDAEDETYEGFTATPVSGAVGWNSYKSGNDYINSYSEAKGVLDYVSSDINKGVGSFSGYSALEENSDLPQNLTTNVPFKIASESLNATSKNAFVFKGTSDNLDNVTVSGSGMASDYLNILFAVGTNSNARYPIVKLEFNDGTEAEYKFNLQWAREQGGPSYYCQKPNLVLTNGSITTAENIDTNSMKLRAVSIPTGGKSIKNVTINAHWTALVAMTEFPYTASEYKAKKGTEVTTAWETVNNSETVSNMKNILLYADEAEANGFSLSDILDNAENVDDKLAYYREIVENTGKPYYYILDFNTSIFGEVDDSVTEWGFPDINNSITVYNGFTATPAENGTSGWNTYRKNGAFVNSYSAQTGILNYASDDINNGVYADFTQGSTKDGYDQLPSNDEVKTKLSEVPFKIDSNSLKKDGKNAYLFDKETPGSGTPCVLNGSGAASSYLNILYAVGLCSTSSVVEIEYSDSSTAKYWFKLNWAREVSGSNYYCQKPDLYLNDGALATSEDIDTNSSKLRAISIPTNGKSIKSVSVKADRSALVAITELPLSYEEFMAKKGETIKSAWDSVKTNSTDESIKAFLGYVNEMEKGGIPLTAIDSSKASDGSYVIENAVKAYKANDGKADLIWSYTNVGGNATVKLTNTTGKQQSYSVIMASYSGNMLTGFNLVPVTMNADEYSVEKLISVDGGENDTYNVFVWGSLNGLNPLGTQK